MQTTKSSSATTINNAYERALQRARRDGTRILGRGRRKSDGAPIVCVSSAREPNRYHVVVIDRDCIYCDCPSGARGVLCKHEAVVQEALLRGWRAHREEIEKAEEAKLRQALVELLECERIIDEALRAMRTNAVGSPTITQDTAAQLLQPATPPRRPVAPDVRYPDRRAAAADVTVRGWHDVKPISIFKS